jgi:hypothetical protein
MLKGNSQMTQGHLITFGVIWISDQKLPVKERFAKVSYLFPLTFFAAGFHATLNAGRV